MEPGLCARCTELGFPPELETTESDDDDQTSASDEEASAVIDYRDADSEDDIVATDVPQVSAQTSAARQAAARTLRLQQREQQTALAPNETLSSQRRHTGRGRGRGRQAGQRQRRQHRGLARGRGSGLGGFRLEYADDLGCGEATSRQRDQGGDTRVVRGTRPAGSNALCALRL